MEYTAEVETHTRASCLPSGEKAGSAASRHSGAGERGWVTSESTATMYSCAAPVGPYREYASDRPSGDQLICMNDPTAIALLTMRRSAPPSAGIRKMPDAPPPSLMNAIVLPSGDQAGAIQLEG